MKPAAPVTKMRIEGTTGPRDQMSPEQGYERAQIKSRKQATNHRTSFSVFYSPLSAFAQRRATPRQFATRFDSRELTYPCVSNLFPSRGLSSAQSAPSRCIKEQCLSSPGVS